MIKKIQLRGISRTPSDRMSADGGCADSINVHIDQQEVAPAWMPKDVTEDELSHTIVDGEILYIHKNISYNNYIVLEAGGSMLVAYVLNGSSREKQEVMPVESEISDITATGNILVVTTGENVYYSIFKEGHYVSLGGGVPVPYIEFRTYDHDRESTALRTATVQFTQHTGAYGFLPNKWNRILSSVEDSLSTSDREYLDEIREIQSALWGKVEQMRSHYLNDHYFIYPVLARYAVRLYDGRYIHVSAPVYLGAVPRSVTDASANAGDFLSVEGVYDPNDSYLTLTFLDIYSAVAQIKGWDPGDWWDLIESVDLFLSTYVPHPLINSDINHLESSHGDPSQNGGYIKFKSPYSDNYLESQEKNILSATNFYKIASFTKDTIAQLSDANGYDLLTETDIAMQENLVVKERLDADCQGRFIPDRIENYNSRLLSIGGVEEIPSGYGFFPAPYAGPLSPYPNYDRPLKIKYYIRDTATGDVYTVLGRAYDGSTGIPTYIYHYNMSRDYYSEAGGVIFCPDPRCFKVEVMVDISGVEFTATIDMKEHPGLNCSYGYVGAGEQLLDNATSSIVFSEEENNRVPLGGTLMMSEMDNVFVFNFGNRITYGSPIVDVAVITRALSEGQAGGFSIYVFTQEGIFYIKITATGEFDESHFLAKDIALRVLPIDQAVVYIARNAVKILQEQDIVSISDAMLGQAEPLPEEVTTLLSGSQWASLASLSESKDMFISFMAAAKVAYDYNGSRLLFFNDSANYQYVYMLNTQSWHKLAQSAILYTPLNSFPECLVARESKGPIKNYVTITKVTSLVNTAGVLVAHGIYPDDAAAEAALASLPLTFNVSRPVEATQIVNDLEGYAEAVTGRGASYVSRIMDYTTWLDHVETGHNPVAPDVSDAVAGFICTRSLDLDAPDVRKSIDRIRIRGNMRKGDAQYVLLGSMDGRTWRIISLRSGSYKFFKIVLLTDLCPSERVSWVEVSYETRFDNKIR